MIYVNEKDSLLTYAELEQLITNGKTNKTQNMRISNWMNITYFELLKNTVKTRHSLMFRELGISYWLFFTKNS